MVIKVAANFTDEERDERVLFVGKFFINNPGVSIRKASEYISTNFFKISTATIHDYLERFKKLASENKQLIEEHINNNREDTIAKEEIKNRVMNNAELCLNGLTINDISKKTGLSYWIVYRDLALRLPKINISLYDQVKDKLKDNTMENIQKK